VNDHTHIGVTSLQRFRNPHQQNWSLTACLHHKNSTRSHLKACRELSTIIKTQSNNCWPHHHLLQMAITFNQF